MEIKMKQFTIQFFSIVAFTNIHFISSFISNAHRNIPTSSPSTSSLFIFQTETKSITSSTSNDNETNNVIPFIIEELTQFKANKASEEISDLVIKVFFEEEAELQSEKRSMT